MSSRALPFAVLAVVAIATGVATHGNAATMAVRSDHLSTFAAAGPTTVPTDTTAPTAVLAAFDDDHDGRIDRMTADFDEPLGAGCTATAWTVQHGSTSYTPTVDAPAAGDVITLSLGTQLPVDTATTALSVSLAPGAGGYCDAAANQAGVVSARPADQARPLLLSVTSANGGSTVGVLQTNDTITFGFSEPMAVPSGGAGSIALRRPNAGNNTPAELLVGGVFAGYASTNAPDGQYLRKKHVEVAFSASITDVGSGLVARATNGFCDASANGSCAPGGPVTFTFALGSLVDRSGQPLWTTAFQVTSLQLF